MKKINKKLALIRGARRVLAVALEVHTVTSKVVKGCGNLVYNIDTALWLAEYKELGGEVGQMDFGNVRASFIVVDG